MGSMNWSRASAGLKPHVPLEVTAAEMLREILILPVKVSPARGGGAAAEPRAGDFGAGAAVLCSISEFDCAFAEVYLCSFVLERSPARSQMCLFNARHCYYSKTVCLTAFSGNSLQLFIWDAELSARLPAALQ